MTAEYIDAHIAETHIVAFEKAIKGLIKRAKKQRKKAKKSKHQQYFEGKQDAFKQVLIELKHLRYELGNNLESDADERHDDPDARIETPGSEAAVPSNADEELLKVALECGIITRKISLYLYEDFPHGKVRGKKLVFEQFCNEELVAKIRRQIAEKTANTE
jgi:hypothetical protein